MADAIEPLAASLELHRDPLRIGQRAQQRDHPIGTPPRPYREAERETRAAARERRPGVRLRRDGLIELRSRGAGPRSHDEAARSLDPLRRAFQLRRDAWGCRLRSGPAVQRRDQPHREQDRYETRMHGCSSSCTRAPRPDAGRVGCEQGPCRRIPQSTRPDPSMRLALAAAAPRDRRVEHGNCPIRYGPAARAGACARRRARRRSRRRLLSSRWAAAPRRTRTPGSSARRDTARRGRPA